MSRRESLYGVMFRGFQLGLALLLVGTYMTIDYCHGHVFRIGYISGSRRDNSKESNKESYYRTISYDRPGYQISGAISLAVDQINKHTGKRTAQNCLRKNRLLWPGKRHGIRIWAKIEAIRHNLINTLPDFYG